MSFLTFLLLILSQPVAESGDMSLRVVPPNGHDLNRCARLARHNFTVEATRRCTVAADGSLTQCSIEYADRTMPQTDSYFECMARRTRVLRADGSPAVGEVITEPVSRRPQRRPRNF